MTPRWLPLVLSVVAGCVDTTSFLTLSHLFAAHVTGNVVVLAASLVSQHPQGAASQLVSVPVFVVVVCSAAVLTEAAKRHQQSALRWLLCVETLLLAMAVAQALIFSPAANADAPAEFWLGMTLVAAMSVQNALNPVVLNNAPATTVMTGNLARLVADAARLLPYVSDDPAQARDWSVHVHQLLLPVVGFIGGCAIGATLFPAVGFAVLVVPLGVVGAATLVTR